MCKPLDIINKFRKNVGYRISIQKSTLLLHTSNKQLENKIKEHQQHQLLGNKSNKIFARPLH